MTSAQLLRNVILSVILLGVTITFLLIGRTPGTRIYAVSIVISLAFFFASLSMWKGSRLLGFLALAIVILSMVWKPMQPISSLLALLIAVLGVTSGELRFRSDDTLTL